MSAKKKKEYLKKKKLENKTKLKSYHEKPAEAEISKPSKISNKKPIDLRTVHYREPKEVMQRRKEQSYAPFAPLEDPHFYEHDPKDHFVVDLPERPGWDKSMSVQSLNAQEKKYFDKYIDSVLEFGLEKLNRFERNLDVWKQLWRVSEFASMFIVVCDVRFAGFLCPPSLLRSLQKQFPSKPILVLINKCDLVPAEAVEAWKSWFTANYPFVRVGTLKSWGDIRTDSQDVKREKLDETKNLLGTVLSQIMQMAEALDFSLTNHDFRDADYNADSSEEEEVNGLQGNETGKSADEFVISIVGQPNVGKSSVINHFLQNHNKRRVAVSANPGKTKHFQTMFLSSTKRVKIVDCPGLIFPAVNLDLPMQVLCGSYPIAQLREPYSTIGFIAKRVPLWDKYKLKKIYQDEENWSPFEIC